MYNWSIDEENLKKKPEYYTIWKLEQQINFGLGDDRLDLRKLKKYWDKINIDPARRKFLKLFIDG